jgi:hypothetical protein
MDEPKDVKSRIESRDPNLEAPKTDTHDPMRIKLRTETTLPICTTSKDDNEEPNFEIP